METPAGKVLKNPIIKSLGGVGKGAKFVLDKTGYIGATIFASEVFSKTEIYKRMTSDVDVNKILTDWGVLSEDGKDGDFTQVIKDILTKGGERAVAAGKDTLSEILRWVGFLKI